MPGLASIKSDLSSLANPSQAKLLSGFFKTGIGQYGEGDIFLGIKVPVQREVAKKYWQEISMQEIRSLLYSKIHEHRLVSLLCLIHKYEMAGDEGKKELFDFYLKNAKQVNNWDLVDTSSHKIVGVYLLTRNRDILYKLSKSSNLWERRISIISTFAFIRKGELEDSFALAKLLLNDKHDLMHKAVGWMLRECGKKDEKALLRFLDENASIMPRTALRYSIERLDKKKRLHYLSKSGNNHIFKH